MAELVIADAAYKTYPGGVVVLRASDWMAAARGTLSSEADARSACGTVVRDSQQVATSIFSDPNGAFQEAEDTLEIDFSLLPLEIDMTYVVFVSLLIEGDWDSTNTDTTRSGTQEEFVAACDLRWYGDSTFFLSDTDTDAVHFKPRALDSYRIVGFGDQASVGDVVGNEVLHWRAYSQDGTTIEWLIDQIYFVPNVISGVHGVWRPDDFRVVGGQASTFGSYDLTDGSYVDGADAGDDNGKFTWHPIVLDDPTGLSGVDGGGDYQRKATAASAEYMARVIPNDGYYLANTEPIPDVEAVAHCYGLHGPFFIPAQEWTNDDFARTVGDGNFAGADNHFLTQNWGLTPEGFAWRADGSAGPSGVSPRLGRATWVDGAEAVMQIRQSVNGSLRAFLRSYGGETGPNTGADLFADNLILRGKFRAVATGAGASAASVQIGTEIRIGGGASFSVAQAIYINFNLLAGTWNLQRRGDVTIAGPITEAWWPGTAGFRIEVRRYLIRARVWDASGAEPSTWDVEMFRPIIEGGVWDDYDYADNLEYALLEHDVATCALWFDHTGTPTAYTTVYWDDLIAENDPGGSNESAFASIEQPEGTQRGEIEMPSGCQHLVYWGTRDWTALDFGNPYLDYSAKVWNDSAAAELQRSEAVWWWFRSTRAGIVPMNWRSADRSPGIKRILVGG